MLKFSFYPDEDNLGVSFHGDLDIDSTEIVEEEIIPTMEKYKHVKINFVDVPFVDSSGMGLLLNIVRTLNEKGTKVTIANVRDEVMEIFELLQIPSILGEEIFI